MGQIRQFSLTDKILITSKRFQNQLNSVGKNSNSGQSELKPT